MSGLHFLDITLEPYRDTVFREASDAVRRGVTKGEGQVICMYKIVGERRLIVVVNGGVEGALMKLTSACGTNARVTCTPLCNYEDIVKTMLNLDDALFHRPAGDLEGQFYWIHSKGDHKGISGMHLMDTWRREAEKLLGMRSRGELNIELFKVLGSREIEIFLKAANNEALEKLLWQMPAVQELGSQLQYTIKSLTPM